MLYLNNCLFIHIAKTGGTSLCYYVLDCILGKQALYNLLSTKKGWKHAYLRSIYHQKELLDLDPNKIKYVVVLFRNPYDRMVSLYHFFKQFQSRNLKENFPELFEIAKLPFPKWVVALGKLKKHYTWTDYKEYIILKDGTLPTNLIVLRYEDYEESAHKIVELFGGKVDSTIQIRHDNKTERPKDWRMFYTKEAEEAVYRYHKWVFDNGYYKREIFLKDKNHSGMVVWLTGLSGSGKTTLSNMLMYQLRKEGYKVTSLDGDEIRNVFPNTGFSKKARDEHILSIGKTAAILENKGFVVVCSFISPYRNTRNNVRNMCAKFTEVFVDCPIDECIKRDPKGIYKKALAGEIKSFTGIHEDASYEHPENPELHLNTQLLNINECTNKIIKIIKEKVGP